MVSVSRVLWVWLALWGGVNGAMANSLKPCPDRPNCVSTLQGGEQSLPPLRYQGDKSKAKSDLLRVVRSLAHMQIIEDKGDYLHVTVTSAIFKFVDDVEFLIEDSHKVIHVRSASRTGYSDFGVNRRRVEKIQRLFAALQ